MIIFLIIAAGAVVMLYPCFMASGQCSREEEREARIAALYPDPARPVAMR